MIRVFIVAASPLARAGLENLLAARGMKVAGSVANLRATLDHLADAGPDVILIDMSGETLENMLEPLAESGLAEDFRTVLLADALSPADLAHALRAGVQAVLPGEISPDQLVAALQAASSGLVILHPMLVPTPLRAGAAQALPMAGAANGLDPLIEPLTPREGEVLQMLSAGLGNKEIAARLNISDHTVKFHVASILGKLGVSSRTEAVSYALRRGLVLL